MTPRSLEQLNKSTTGRIISAGMRLLDSVAPAAAQRLAFDWFGRPRRRVGRPAIGAHRFRLTGDGPELAVWDWGDGPTVLLVHGWNGNAAQLVGLVPPLLRAVAACGSGSGAAPGGGAGGARVVRSPRVGAVATGVHARPPRPRRSRGPAGRRPGPRPGLARSPTGDARGRRPHARAAASGRDLARGRLRDRSGAGAQRVSGPVLAFAARR